MQHNFRVTFLQVAEEAVRYFSYRVSSMTRTKGGGGYRHRKHQHRYIAPEFNYTAKYWALVSETTTPPPNNTKHNKCTLKEAQSEEMAKVICSFYLVHYISLLKRTKTIALHNSLSGVTVL